MSPGALGTCTRVARKQRPNLVRRREISHRVGYDYSDFMIVFTVTLSFFDHVTVQWSGLQILEG